MTEKYSYFLKNLKTKGQFELYFRSWIFNNISVFQQNFRDCEKNNIYPIGNPFFFVFDFNRQKVEKCIFYNNGKFIFLSFLGILRRTISEYLMKLSMFHWITWNMWKLSTNIWRKSSFEKQAPIRWRLTINV